MNKISQNIDLLNERIGKLTSYLAIPLILITFLVAFMRYALDFGSIAIQEITIYLHALIFTTGASYTLKNNGGPKMPGKKVYVGNLSWEVGLSSTP